MSKSLQHIAFIMDGNGRWAKERGLPRSMGHAEGVKSLKRILTHCRALNIRVVSLYAFSTENWNRPKSEINMLFKMLASYLKSELNDIVAGDVQVRIMGDYSALPKTQVDVLNKAIEKSKHCTKFVLNIGINYGARQEIVYAVNRLIAQGKQSVSAEDIADNLYTAGLADPDLIVRTSGEQRLSNFMLFQAAYSELYFTKCYWPDFNEKELERAVEEYNSRNRRYGGVSQ